MNKQRTCLNFIAFTNICQTPGQKILWLQIHISWYTENNGKMNLFQCKIEWSIFDQWMRRRLIFSGPVITLGLTGKSLSAVKWELMNPTRRSSVSLVPERGMFLWMPSLLISGGPLLSAVFGLSSSLEPLVGGGGGLVCESVGKADLLSDHFDSKQSRESVDLPLTWYPPPRFTLPSLPSGWVRLGISCWTWTLMGALTDCVCFLFFLKEQLPSPARIAVCNTWSSRGTALCRVEGATSQLDLLFLTPLSVAGCGWLQLGAPHWATSANYCK